MEMWNAGRLKRLGSQCHIKAINKAARNNAARLTYVSKEACCPYLPVKEALALGAILVEDASSLFLSQGCSYPGQRAVLP